MCAAADGAIFGGSMQQFPNDSYQNVRSLLEQEKKRLNERITQLTSQDPFTDPERASDNAASDTEASEEFNHDRVSAVIEELKRDVDTIDEALLRIGDGSYGTCVLCKSAIDARRLRALPTAQYCSSCESKRTQIPKR